VNEYRVVYTIKGQGWKDGHPWVDAIYNDLKTAQYGLVELKKDNVKFGVSEEWIEVRQITPWKRLDDTDDE
jgi:hypothetical protein